MSKFPRHQWRVSPIIENWQNCKNCPQKRHKVKGKYYYDSLDISKTYCRPAKYEKEHLCPYCKEIWTCGEPDCREKIEMLCEEHDTRICRAELGGKWYDDDDLDLGLLTPDAKKYECFR